MISHSPVTVGKVTEITLSHVIVVLVRMFMIYDLDFHGGTEV